MTDYDEPIEELNVPKIIIGRLRRGGIGTILQAAAWLKSPHGLGLDGDQINLLRRAIDDWQNGTVQ